MLRTPPNPPQWVGSARVRRPTGSPGASSRWKHLKIPQMFHQRPPDASKSYLVSIINRRELLGPAPASCWLSWFQEGRGEKVGDSAPAPFAPPATCQRPS